MTGWVGRRGDEVLTQVLYVCMCACVCVCVFTGVGDGVLVQALAKTMGVDDIRIKQDYKKVFAVY